jgi:hypothetical protein
MRSSRFCAWSLCYLTMLSAVPPLLCQGDRNTVTGVVRSQTGEPLAGVTVREIEHPNPKTDQNGRYRIELPSLPDKCCVLQFRHEGYKTVTKIVDPGIGVLDIVLEAGESKWIPPDWNPSDSKRIGWRMKFAVPKGVKVKRVRGFDASEIHISFRSAKRREWLHIGTGGNWSSGLPLIFDLKNSIYVTERDMACGSIHSVISNCARNASVVLLWHEATNDKGRRNRCSRAAG